MTEDDIQIAAAQFLARALPAGVFWSAVNPQPGKVSKRMGALRKAMGLRAGVPDLMFIIGGRFLGIEMKRPGDYQRTNQKEVQSEIEAAGGAYVVCRSVEDVANALAAHGVPLHAKVNA